MRVAVVVVDLVETTVQLHQNGTWCLGAAEKSLIRGAPMGLPFLRMVGTFLKQSLFLFFLPGVEGNLFS